MGFRLIREPRRIFEWQDVVDFIDDIGREIDKRDKEIKDLKQRNDELVMLLDIEKRRNLDGNNRNV